MSMKPARLFSRSSQGRATPGEYTFGRLHFWLAWLLPAAALGLTLWIWQDAATEVTRTANERFQFRQNEVTSAIHGRMAAYEQVLRGTLGLLMALPEASRTQWQEYVTTLKIDEHYPGLQGIGYSKWIHPEDKEAYMAHIRQEGFHEFAIYPSGIRPEYTSITYLEPFDQRNRRAFGYDMWSEHVRRTAMAQARDTGQTSISGKVTLVQETDTDVQAGVLMYLPYYQPGLPRETVEERRRALQGFVYSPFRMRNLMAGILGHALHDVKLEIFDGTELSATTLMYDSEAGEQPSSALPYKALRATTTLLINEHLWTVRFTTLPPFHASLDTYRPGLFLITGSLVSVLCAAVVWSFTTMRRRATALAQQMTLELNRHTEALARSNAELETFAYVASHDLKAPLRGIDNLASWIEEELGEALQGETREYMTLLRGRVHRLDKLLEDLLQYSRVGRTAASTELVNVEKLVADIFELLNTQHTFRLDFLTPLPTFPTVRSRLEQVFSNLISNALKYHDHLPGILQVSVYDRADFYEFVIADNGPGIAPAYHDKVFQMFQRLRARDDIEGSGMGLAIIKKIIEEQGGHIWIEYTDGTRGATFRFEWPKHMQGG